MSEGSLEGRTALLSGGAGGMGPNPRAGRAALGPTRGGGANARSDGGGGGLVGWWLVGW